MFNKFFDWLEQIIVPDVKYPYYILKEKNIYSAVVVDTLENLGFDVTDNPTTAFPELINAWYNGNQYKFVPLHIHHTHTIEVHKDKVIVHYGKLEDVKFKKVLTKGNCKVNKPAHVVKFK